PRPGRVDGAAVVAAQEAARLHERQRVEAVRPARRRQRLRQPQRLCADARLALRVGLGREDRERPAARPAAVALEPPHPPLLVLPLILPPRDRIAHPLVIVLLT